MPLLMLVRCANYTVPSRFVVSQKFQILLSENLPFKFENQSRCHVSRCYSHFLFLFHHSETEICHSVFIPAIDHHHHICHRPSTTTHHICLATASKWLLACPWAFHILTVQHLDCNFFCAHFPFIIITIITTIITSLKVSASCGGGHS